MSNFIYTSEAASFAAAVSSATNKTLVIDSHCTATQNEVLGMPVIFAGGYITTSGYSISFPNFTQPFMLEYFGGGTGTGISDNSGAFIDAINALKTTAGGAGGGTLQLGAGVYQIAPSATTIIMASNITVQGAGREATTIQVVGTPTSATLGYDIFTATLVNDIAFTDLTIDGGSNNSSNPRQYPPWLSAPAAAPTYAPVTDPQNDYWPNTGSRGAGKILDPQYWAYPDGICQAQAIGGTNLVLNGVTVSGGIATLQPAVKRVQITSVNNIFRER
jgi:hypothetical protein